MREETGTIIHLQPHLEARKAKENPAPEPLREGTQAVILKYRKMLGNLLNYQWEPETLESIHLATTALHLAEARAGGHEARVQALLDDLAREIDRQRPKLLPDYSDSESRADDDDPWLFETR